MEDLYNILELSFHASRDIEYNVERNCPEALSAQSRETCTKYNVTLLYWDTKNV